MDLGLPPDADYTPRRPWDWLSDAELAALRPFFERQGAGRPIHDLRARLDAVFWVACRNGPWKDLPRDMGPADTASRQFRRWAHAGVWTRLLQAVAAPDCPPVLRRLAHWICRAYRRALRILGLRGMLLAKRLGLLSALPAPWWMLPKPDLSESCKPLFQALLARLHERVAVRDWAGTRPFFRELRWLHRWLGGQRITRHMAPP